MCPLLDVEDMVRMKKPDWKCVFTYVQSFYRRFRLGRDKPSPTKTLFLERPPAAAAKHRDGGGGDSEEGAKPVREHERQRHEVKGVAGSLTVETAYKGAVCPKKIYSTGWLIWSCTWVGLT